MHLDAEKLRPRLEPLFQKNFDLFGELGAAFSVWQNGKPLVDLYGGFCDAGREKPWTADTAVLVWSATKGIGSACVLHALQQQKIELNRPVAEFWPEFGQAGKDKITLGQLLSHQAGLSALDQRVDVVDYDGVIRALEAQAPLWPPGTGHGYHARTFGFLLDELIRRITGKTLSDYWQENFTRPLELDFWIGLPEEQNSRVATVYAAKSGKPPEPAKFYRDLVAPGTLARKTFTSPYGLNVISKMNGAADCFVRRDWERLGACEILFHARQRRRIRWADFLFSKNDRMDDNHIIRRHRPCFSNPDGILGRVYERLTRCSTHDVRTTRDILRTSRCGRQPRLCRSGKQNRVRLRNEPNGTIGSAEREIAAIGGRDL
jgi:CubicO group peptidase (beta-lactamase class C family)